MVDYPILIYDDRCASCTRYAMLVNRILQGRITMMGHYAKIGVAFKRGVFPAGYDSTGMSWFVTKTHAYGGSRGLLRLAMYALSAKRGRFQENTFAPEECSSGCHTIRETCGRMIGLVLRGATVRRACS